MLKSALWPELLRLILFIITCSDSKEAVTDIGMFSENNQTLNQPQNE